MNDRINIGLDLDGVLCEYPTNISDAERDDIPDFWLNLKPLYTPKDLEPFVNNIDFRTYFITKRRGWLGRPPEDQSASWLRTNYYVLWPTVICTSEKGKVADALNLDYYVDDRIDLLMDVWEISGCKCYLFDGPENQEVPANIGFERVYNFADLLNHIQKDWKLFGRRKGNVQKLLEESNAVHNEGTSDTLGAANSGGA